MNTKTFLLISTVCISMAGLSGCGLKMPKWTPTVEEDPDNVPHRVGHAILENVHMDAAGSYDLGEVYFQKGTDADYKIAAHYFMNGADGGDKHAQARLGEMYLYGI